MIKRLLTLLGTSLVIAQSGFALITFDITKGGFENGSGIATNGMSFGFIIDTGSDGFGFGNYIPFDITENGQFLADSGGATDDWFVYGGSLGTGQTPPTTVFGGPLGNGSIGSVSNIEETNISSGLDFAVIWFPDNTASIVGTTYGGTSDGGVNMVTPGSGGSNVSPASLMSLSTDYTIAAVPEPSAYALAFGLVSLIGLACRRLR